MYFNLPGNRVVIVTGTIIHLYRHDAKHPEFKASLTFDDQRHCRIGQVMEHYLGHEMRSVLLSMQPREGSEWKILSPLCSTWEENYWATMARHREE